MDILSSRFLVIIFHVISKRWAGFEHREVAEAWNIGHEDIPMRDLALENAPEAIVSATLSNDIT